MPLHAAEPRGGFMPPIIARIGSGPCADLSNGGFRPPIIARRLGTRRVTDRRSAIGAKIRG